MKRPTAILIIVMCLSLAATAAGGAGTLADCCLPSASPARHAADPAAPRAVHDHAAAPAIHDHGAAHAAQDHGAPPLPAEAADHDAGQDGYPLCGLSVCLKFPEASLQALAFPVHSPDPPTVMAPEGGPAAVAGFSDSIFRPPRS